MAEIKKNKYKKFPVLKDAISITLNQEQELNLETLNFIPNDNIWIEVLQMFNNQLNSEKITLKDFIEKLELKYDLQYKKKPL